MAKLYVLAAALLARDAFFELKRGLYAYSDVNFFFYVKVGPVKDVCWPRRRDGG